MASTSLPTSHLLQVCAPCPCLRTNEPGTELSGSWDCACACQATTRLALAGERLVPLGAMCTQHLLPVQRRAGSDYAAAMPRMLALDALGLQCSVERVVYVPLERGG